jgi:hypothetical protein
MPKDRVLHLSLLQEARALLCHGHIGLGFKVKFDQSFEKPVFSNEGFRLFVIRQQPVFQFVVYGHFSSFESFCSFLPLNRLHKI